MGANSGIQWTDHTFNPWIGCAKVSPGCDHCYAEAWAKRYGAATWGSGQPRKLTSDSNWNQPLRWNAKAEKDGVRYRVFCASLADVFDNEVDPAWRERLWSLIRATPHLDWLLLTKRIGNVAKMLPDDWDNDWSGGYANVWLGITVVDQEEADRDIPKLRRIAAKRRFLSMEPLLGPVDLKFPTNREVHETAAEMALDSMFFSFNKINPDAKTGDGIHWVIVGGESGAGARPMHPNWVKSLRDQCTSAGVAFFFKQWGEFEYHPTGFWNFEVWVNKARGWIGGMQPPAVCIDSRGRICRIGVDMMRARDEGAFPVAIGQRVGKKAAGRLLDGHEWNFVPKPAA